MRAAILLLALLTGTAFAQPKFETLGETEDFAVAIDLNSVAVSNDTNEVGAAMKRTLKTPIVVKGKTKKGSYYIEVTSVLCDRRTFTIKYSSLFSADNELLISGEANKTFEDPRRKGNFLTDYIELMCNTAKSQPKITI